MQSRRLEVAVEFLPRDTPFLTGGGIHCMTNIVPRSVLGLIENK